MFPPRPTLRRRADRALLCASVATFVLGLPAGAQQAEDIFEGFGTASRVEAEAPKIEEGSGSIEGVVVDQASGIPIAGATVIITLVTPADAEDEVGRQDIRSTDSDGSFDFSSVSAGRYKIDFVKSGYRASSMTDFEVTVGQVNRADFPMPPLAMGSSGDVLNLEAFVVEASTVGEIMDSLDLRLESDQMLNILSAEDLSKFAASDVADALKRVAGVNVVEGQFAIIRGLEDRYSSTLFNGAIVPSPDPDRQSVQLDLFPSDVVSNLQVSKTFAPGLPSNSAGGSIDILTHAYPEAITLKFSAGSGFNERAKDGFLRADSLNPVGFLEDDSHIIESDFSGTLAGIVERWDREFRFKFVGQNEIDFDTRTGVQETREPALCRDLFYIPCDQSNRDILYSGDLAFGELTLTEGRFDLTQSTRTEQTTYYAGLSLDLDEEAKHRIDFSYLHTEKSTETTQLRENGFIQDRKTRIVTSRRAPPVFDYASLAAAQLDEGWFCFSDAFGNAGRDGECTNAASPNSWIARNTFSDGRSQFGAYIGTSFLQSQTFINERELWIAQIGGEHEVPYVDGLDLRWTYNRAKTSQSDVSRRVRGYFIPDDPAGLPAIYPPPVSQLPSGRWQIIGDEIIVNELDVDEEQDFFRIDLDYERSITDWFDFGLTAGIWYEDAARDVEARFLLNSQQLGAGVLTGSTFLDAGATLATGLVPDTNVQTNESTREIFAFGYELKSTLWEKLDILGGLRIEDINIQSKNDPFLRDPTTGAIFDPANPSVISVTQPDGSERFLSVRAGAPGTFPSVYILFDRVDNPFPRIDQALAPGGIPQDEGVTTVPTDQAFNDQLAGLDLPTSACNRFQSGVDPSAGPQGCVDFVTAAEILSIVNGEIDERFYLPSVGFAYRPLEGLSLRAAYSQTVARPSFREVGFYLSVEPGNDDFTVGNPQLGLSEVDSYDVRVEYSWGDFGDLVGLSGFYKDIEDPIESVVLRDQFNFEGGGLFRTFLNNQNPARLWGIEVEARKQLDFTDLFEFMEKVPLLEYFSVGGNYTYIDAEVERSAFELQRAQQFFEASPADLAVAPYRGLETRRRLFGQPEWIANLDLSFDMPDWGTSFTLAWFAISDVLDAAGTASILPNGQSQSLTLDRYVASFNQLDLVFRQQIWRGLSFKLSVKNLTDSTRKIIYDRNQTNRQIAERTFQVGRDYSFAFTYSHEF